MKGFRYLVFGLLFLGWVAGMVVMIPRLATENRDTDVELVLDLGSARDFCNKYSYRIDQFLGQLKAAGLTSLAVKEVTPQDLQDRGAVALYSGGELLANLLFSRMAGLNAPDIHPNHSYLLVADRDSFAWLKESLRERFGAERVRSQEVGSLYLLEVPMTPKDFLSLPLGLWPKDLQLVQESGLNLVPRPYNHPGVTNSEIRDFFETVQALRARLVIFDGTEVLGFPDHLTALIEGIQQNQMTVGMIETPVQLGHIDQKGLYQLVPEIAYRAARLYTLYPKEMEKLSVADLVDRSVRSVRERNIRILYLRAVDKPGYSFGALLSMNLEYVRGLKTELVRYGLGVGSASHLNPIRVGRGVSYLISLAILAAGLWLVGELFSIKSGYLRAILFLLALFALGLYWIAPELARSGFALSSALIFPILATYWATSFWTRRGESSEAAAGPWPLLRQGVSGLLLASGISLVGAFYISTLLGDIRYLLEMEYFRGVKLAFTFPLLLIPFIYFRFISRERLGIAEVGWEPTPGPEGNGEAGYLWRRIGDVLGEKVLVRDLFILSLAVVVLYLYLGRSGHTAGIPVSGLEVEARSFLDDLMMVRPRTKEFLIGHPAFLLVPLALRFLPRVWVFPLLAFGMVGQISMINSFEHIRSPWLLSLWRGGNGLLLGVGLGVMAVLFGYYTCRWLEGRGIRLKGPGRGENRDSIR